jgi:hypothetical protein
MCSLTRALFAALILFPPVAVAAAVFAAAQSSPAEPTREQLQLQISIMQDYVKKVEADLHSRPQNAELEKAYIDAKKRQYEYLTAIMDINLRAFEAQRLASFVILLLVVLVVVSGTGFAGFQLWKSVSMAGVQSSSDLEVSASKVRLTSSVVGVVVLTISLVFLYIYANEIYHLRVIDQTTVTPEEKTSK